MFSRLAILLIVLYQRCISPFIPSRCRFYPTCSSYAKEAFIQHNFFYGMWLTVGRIVRCAPWSSGGCDPVPEKKIKMNRGEE